MYSGGPPPWQPHDVPPREPVAPWHRGLPPLLTEQELDHHLGEHPEHEWFTYSASQELWEAWEALPLIVLAGLRVRPS